MIVLLSLVDNSILRPNLTLASTNFLVWIVMRLRIEVFGSLMTRPLDIEWFTMSFTCC
jgi:hypothetical protein